MVNFRKKKATSEPLYLWWSLTGGVTRDVTGFVAKPSCYDRSDSPEVLGSKLRPVLNVSLKPLFTPDMIFLLSHMRGGTSWL